MKPPDLKKDKNFSEIVKKINQLPKYGATALPSKFIALRKEIKESELPKELPATPGEHKSPVTVYYDAQRVSASAIPATLHDRKFYDKNSTYDHCKHSKHRLQLAEQVRLLGDGLGERFSPSHEIELLTGCAINLSGNDPEEIAEYCKQTPKKDWEFQDTGLARYHADMYILFKRIIYISAIHAQKQNAATALLLPFFGGGYYLNALTHTAKAAAKSAIHHALFMVINDLKLMLKDLKIIYSLPCFNHNQDYSVAQTEFKKVFQKAEDVNHVLLVKADLFAISRILQQSGITSIILNPGSNFSIGGRYRNLEQTLEEVIFTLTDALNICAIDYNAALADTSRYVQLPQELNTLSISFEVKEKKPIDEKFISKDDYFLKIETLLPNMPLELRNIIIEYFGETEYFFMMLPIIQSLLAITSNQWEKMTLEQLPKILQAIDEQSSYFAGTFAYADYLVPRDLFQHNGYLQPKEALRDLLIYKSQENHIGCERFLFMSIILNNKLFKEDYEGITYFFIELCKFAGLEALQLSPGVISLSEFKIDNRCMVWKSKADFAILSADSIKIIKVTEVKKNLKNIFKQFLVHHPQRMWNNKMLKTQIRICKTLLAKTDIVDFNDSKSLTEFRDEIMLCEKQATDPLKYCLAACITKLNTIIDKATPSPLPASLPSAISLSQTHSF